MKIFRSALLALAGCAVMLGGCAQTLGTSTATHVSTISRTALDFAFHSFDAALYGLDAAMDAHLLTPGSAKAKEISAVGKTVLKWLNAADAARNVGNAAGYEAAFAQALASLDQFRALLGTHAVTSFGSPPDRSAILARAAA